jgi:hypothetical protein
MCCYYICQGIGVCIGEIFDPNQPFYVKYGFPKAVMAEVAAATPLLAHEVKPCVDIKFLSDLAVNDVVDYMGKESDIWETGVVAAISHSRTEMEILNVQTG